MWNFHNVWVISYLEKTIFIKLIDKKNVGSLIYLLFGLLSKLILLDIAMEFSFSKHAKAIFQWGKQSKSVSTEIKINLTKQEQEIDKHTSI